MTTGEINNTKRIVWIDNFKSFAIFLLFWGHCCGCMMSETFNLFIVAWHMPLFVFASGYMAVKLRGKIHSWGDVDAYIQKLALHIALPNMLFTCLAMAVGYGAGARWSRMLICLVGLTFFLLLGYLFYTEKIKDGRWIKYALILVSFIFTPIWYLPFMIEVMIIFVVAQCVSYKYFHNNSWVFAFLFTAVMMVIPSPFHATAEFVIIFLVAMLVNYRKGLIEQIYSNIKWGGTLLICAAMGVVGWFTFKDYVSLDHQFYLSWWYSLIREGDWSTFPLRQLTILMFVPAIAAITALCSGKYNWFSRYGSLTLAMYALNCIFVVLFEKVLDPAAVYEADSAMWWYVILDMLAVLGSTLIVVELFNKSKYLRFCFFGEKKTLNGK